MKLFCWIFILSVAIVSPLFLDLYPFSVFPMFSDNTSQYVVVEVRDIDGNPLNVGQYGLQKIRLANRSQRYGLRLGPNYFDDYETIQAEQVKDFLASNFPDQAYPIVLRHWTRGFDQTTRTINNLTDPHEFRIDQASVCIAAEEVQSGSLKVSSGVLETGNSKEKAPTRRK